MIDILQQPYPCSFSKNTVEFQVSSNQQYPEDIILPYLQIRVLAIPVNGTIISWSFTNPVTLELVEISISVAYSVYLPNQLSSAWVGGYAGYAEYMVGRLQQLEELNAFFTISHVGPFVHITAKQPIPELIPINWSDNQLLTTYFQEEIFDTYMNPDERPGYTMQAIVYFEKEYESNEFEVVGELDLVTDMDGIAKIDIGDILDSEIENSMEHMQIPHFANTEKIGLLRRYYVVFVEYWNDSIEKIEKNSKLFHVSYGGYSTDDEMMSDPMSIFQGKKQFLTWWPNRKQLLPKQPDWLGFMNTTQITTTFLAKVKLVTDVGNTVYTLGTIQLKPWESMLIPVGYEQKIEGLIPVGQYLNYWEIYVEKASVLDPGDAGIGIAPRRYYLNVIQGCTYNYILFYNSFGCPETVGTTEWEETMNVSSSLINQSSLMNQNRLKGGIFVFDSTHNNTFVTRTVTMTKEEGFKLQSVINSLASFVWRFNRWIPAVLQIDKAKVLLESEYTTDLSIEFMIASINDRASFSMTTPKLQLIENEGITTFILDTNGIDIEDYGVLKIYKNEGVVYSPVWNVTERIWEMDPPITEEGEFVAFVECYDFNDIPYPVRLSFRYQPKYVAAFYTTDSNVQLEIQSNNPSEEVQIDYGFGDGWQTETYTTALTSIVAPVLAGKKYFQMRKPSFEDVKLLTITQTDFKDWNWQLFRNIETIAVDEAAFKGIVYLNKLPKLVTVNLANMSLITGVEFGVSPDLTNITLNNLGFNSLSIEAMIDNLWNLRNEFQNTVSIYFVSMGIIPYTSKTTAQINGTGIYTGQGLIADFGWTIVMI